jgi:hypothetical protein
VDAHDYYAYWKIVTAAMNCAIYGQDCDYAGGGTEEQLGMGNWIGGDGREVKRMQYNPDVWDQNYRCFDLEDACNMVNTIDEDAGTGQSCWNWREWDGPLEIASCPLQIRLVIKGNGAGTVTHSLHPGESCTKATSPCKWDFGPDDPPTTLAATADEGSIFTGWGDNCIDVPCTGVTCTVTVDSQYHIVATFDRL